MAEIILPNKNSNTKKLSTHVDLTPMVDLGFLLLTFFIFSSLFALQKTLHLTTPDERETPNTPTEVKASGALSIILDDNHRVLFYEGLTPPLKLDKKHYANIDALRKIITQKRANTNPEDFVVLLKPTDKCDYNDFVRMLNELKINQVTRYSLSNVSKEEQSLLTQNHTVE